jgi:hypothetical protein
MINETDICALTVRNPTGYVITIIRCRKAINWFFARKSFMHILIRTVAKFPAIFYATGEP